MFEQINLVGRRKKVGVAIIRTDAIIGTNTVYFNCLILFRFPTLTINVIKGAAKIIKIRMMSAN